MADDKYITFKREVFRDLCESMRKQELRQGWVESQALQDAVVIRRQDRFAGPALSTYAAMIAMVANNISDPEKGKELLDISDYFDRQAELSYAESWKLPDV